MAGSAWGILGWGWDWSQNPCQYLAAMVCRPSFNSLSRSWVYGRASGRYADGIHTDQMGSSGIDCST